MLDTFANYSNNYSKLQQIVQRDGKIIETRYLQVMNGFIIYKL